MKRFLLVLLLILATIVVAGSIFLWLKRPQLEGEESIPGLHAEVEVYYDAYGIPHIYAENQEDAYRAFGYVHAKDRIFQMELMRRVGAGRLAEIFGRDFIETDMFFRTLGTNRKARDEAENFDSLPPELKSVVLAYLDGVNHFIAQGDLPIEYAVLGLEPEPFSPADIYAIAGYMSYSFSQALRVDPLVEYVDRRFGPEYLVGFHMADVISDTLDKAGPDADLPRDTAAIGAEASAHAGEPLARAELKDLFVDPLPDDFPVPRLQGSNAWVLAPGRTRSGKVLFANDTHIKYGAPAVWYEAHLEYPGHSLYGNFLAGIPFALVGHSRGHAYGLTMFEDDDADFFTEKFAADDSSATFVSDTLTAAVEKFRETVRFDGGDTTFTVYKTYNGVIINRFLPFDFGEPVSMHWNYTEVETDLIPAFFTMQNTADLEEFQAAVSRIGSPGLNVHYGDSAGNIALWAAGKIIKRPAGVDGKRFTPGYVDTLAIIEHFPFADNPQIVNPDSGLVYSANQMHKEEEGGLYPGYYAADTRFERISELLGPLSSATAADMQNTVLDVVSTTEAKIAREFARLVESPSAEGEESARKALEILANWDGSHHLDDVAPTIHYKMLYHVLRYTFVDELGTAVFDHLLGSGHFLTRSYAVFLMRDDFKWWDDVKTGGEKETRSAVFNRAFQQAIKELEDELGGKVEKWTWNRVHTIEHPHPFGAQPFVGRFFNVGPFPAPGGIGTLNNSGFTLNGEGRYVSHYGPAMRILIDFADVENAVSILPTGNGGNVLGSYYRDQAQAFVEGGFRKMMMNEKEIKAVGRKLVLRHTEPGK